MMKPASLRNQAVIVDGVEAIHDVTNVKWQDNGEVGVIDLDGAEVEVRRQPSEGRTFCTARDKWEVMR